MQSLPRPTDWYDVLHQLPEDTGKFDCEVIDSAGMIFPARWLPKSGNLTPAWRVLVTTDEGVTRTQRVEATHMRRWKPREPKTWDKRKPK